MTHFFTMSFSVVFLVMFLVSVEVSYALKPVGVKADVALPHNSLKRLKMSGGFGSEMPKPKIITPSKGKLNSHLEKFLMMYTCKICDGRNAQMVRIFIIFENY